jgi:uncharacterized membrane protein
MTTFTVWKFPEPVGAEHALGILRRAETDGLVKIIDHAVVSWPPEASKPKVHHGKEDTHRGAGWGAFLGALVGMLFLAPFLGGAIGAAMGAATKHSEGTGITKEDLERIRAEITPGTSALFAVTDEGKLDRLAERFHGMNSTLVTTNLTEGEREELLESIGGR